MPCRRVVTIDSSTRFWIRTGLPALRASAAVSGSIFVYDFEPKPPPRYWTTTRTLAEPGAAPRPAWAFVQDRRVGGECRLDRPRDRELLVLDTDRIQGRRCRGFVLGRDRRHRLAGKAHMVERDDRAILDRVTPVGIEVGEIVTGRDADDAAQRLGLARVDGHHSGMGERRPQDLSVHHPRHDEVADELRGPPELLVRVPPWNRAADVRERWPLDDGHSFAPASSATASTIPW